MIKNLKLENKCDYEILLNSILDPVKPLFNNEKSGILLDEYFAAQYSDKVMEMENFSRLLWGINSYSNKLDKSFIDKVIKMISNGTNPKSTEYWGEVKDYDQMIVEMTPIIMFCYKNIDRLREILNSNEIKNIEVWFNKINERKVSDNNWLFFKVLVNLFLNKCNMKYSEIEIEKSFKSIEKMYLGDGWYSDGLSNQRDYYVSFAIHYYSLLYIKYIDKEDDLTKKIKDRAIRFSKDFIYWFSNNGEAIPFGRSLTYKFAQIAFWSALVLNNIYPIPIEEIKGIINRNLRWWFNQNIFNKNGSLQLGYAYKNTLFTENYNASGSSYWALKAFIFLELESNNIFFNCDEYKMPNLEGHVYQEHAYMNLCRDDNQVIAFVNGQYCKNDFSHTECKYEKFAYSTLSGFNISKSHTGISNCSCDSTITVSDDERHFISRTGAKVIKNSKEYMHSVWNPWNNVSIETIVIPKLPMHLRIHKIDSDKEFYFYEGGFCIDNSNLDNRIVEGKNSIKILNDNHIVGVASIVGNGITTVINSAPNSNLLYSRVNVPLIKWKFKKGKYIIVSGIYTGIDEDELERELNKISKIEIKDNRILLNNMSIDISREYKVPNKYDLIKNKVKNKLKNIIK